MPSLNPTASAWSESTRAFPKTGKRGAPQAFAHKLVQLLADEPDDIVAWSEDGTAFSIIDMRRFVSEVLPRHFSAAKFSSFQRQLNLYHFTTITPPADEAASSFAKTYLGVFFFVVFTVVTFAVFLVVVFTVVVNGSAASSQTRSSSS